VLFASFGLRQKVKNSPPPPAASASAALHHQLPALRATSCQSGARGRFVLVVKVEVERRGELTASGLDLRPGTEVTKLRMERQACVDWHEVVGLAKAGTTRATGSLQATPPHTGNRL
jgi:hypothetical protein